MEERLISMLKDTMSPVQIEDRCKRKGIPMISKSGIYAYIRADKEAGGDLHKYLRGGGKKRSKRNAAGRTNRGQISDGVSISERCEEVESRAIAGHWEVDLMRGGRRDGVLVTSVERKSGLTRIRYAESKSMDDVAAAIIDMFHDIKDHVHNITYDNGLEFAAHMRVNRELDCKSYFAHPYCSWERGSIENLNGLVRQWCAKGQPLTRENTANLDQVVRLLNDRPRKRLDFETPMEVFQRETGAKICYN